MNRETASIILLIFQVVIIVFIGIPTVYALIFGVPFVPTPKRIIRKILENIKIKNGMTIYDPGCGDARFLTEASKQANISAIGFEYSPIVYVIANIRNFLRRGKNVKIKLKNYNKHNFKNADIIFTYLMPKKMDSLLEKFKKECKKGTIMISYAFEAKSHKYTKKIPRDEENNLSPIFFYHI